MSLEDPAPPDEAAEPAPTEPAPPRRKVRRKNEAVDLASMPEAELLRLRICDLPVSVEGSFLAPLVRQLHSEMRNKGLSFRPPCYLSTEFFVEKRSVSIGMPFCLAHPRLLLLERKLLYDVEGATPEDAMRILRHEAGHAIDFAYGIYRRRDRQALFGTSSTPYPESYAPKPYSRSFVRHIENWYAQSHPDEDFAETFAVWLKPDSEWRVRYRTWPRALRKLEYVDSVMTSVAGKKAPHENRRRPFDIRWIKETLGEFYEERKAVLGSADPPEITDQDLLKVFPAPKDGESGHEPAHRFLERNRRLLRDLVGKWGGMRKYNVDEMITELKGRCQEKGLVRASDESFCLLNLVGFCVAQSKNHLFSGRFSMGS